MFTLISATPSPYARKVRIALTEKGIPFRLQTEVPWDSTTETPQWNPLEKLPVLISDDDKIAVYESHYILEWLEAKFARVPLLPPLDEIDTRLFAKQIEVVADGICDALVLAFFEKHRDLEKQSTPWMNRQMRKVEGGLRQLARWEEQKTGPYLVGENFGLADIAAGSVCGYLSVRWPDHPWKMQYRGLARYCEMLEERESFRNSVPRSQSMKDKIV